MKKLNVLAAAFAISGVFAFAVPSNAAHSGNSVTEVYSNTIDTVPKPKPNPNPSPNPDPKPNPSPSPNPNPNPPNPPGK